MNNKIDDGGPAFPQWEGHTITSELLYLRGGISVRDFFAQGAPEPTEDDYKFYFEQDKMADPHNDKGKQRSRKEIRAEFKFAYADAMLRARKQL